MRRLFAALVCCLLAGPAFADAADDAALKEIAAALIQKGADGKPYGSLYYQSLPEGTDHRKIIRIYTKPYDRELALVNRNLWYEVAEAQALQPTVQQWALEVYTREFPQIAFEVTEDPTQASMFMVEGRLVPNAHSGKSRPSDMYYKSAANSMNGSVNGHRAALVHLNSLGNPWFKDLIAHSDGSRVRATLLNEMFNGFAVRDYQDLNPKTLSPATQAWLAAHPNPDDYTITRSGGPVEHLKALDKVIVQQLLH